jgi:hypothetical protein
MTPRGAVAVAFVVVMMAMYIVLMRRLRRRRIGPAAVGAFYDMLEKDKRQAIEIVVEQKAEARDAEDRDGDLPNLTGRPTVSN